MDTVYGIFKSTIRTKNTANCPLHPRVLMQLFKHDYRAYDELNKIGKDHLKKLMDDDKIQIVRYLVSGSIITLTFMDEDNYYNEIEYRVESKTIK